MNHKTLISLLIFAAAVLLFTRIDYLTNAELYQFGLQYSDAWWQNYQILYNCLFQFVIGFSLLYSRNWRLAIVQEAFVLSCTQDLVYFGLWSGGVFPSGDWTWMSMYHVVGSWTTSMQIGFSAVFTIAPILVLFALRNYKLQTKWGTPLNLAFKRNMQPVNLAEGVAVQAEIPA